MRWQEVIYKINLLFLATNFICHLIRTNISLHIISNIYNLSSKRICGKVKYWVMNSSPIMVVHKLFSDNIVLSVKDIIQQRLHFVTKFLFTIFYPFFAMNYRYLATKNYPFCRHSSLSQFNFIWQR